MQAGLSSADRNLLWGAGAIAVLLLAATVAFAPSASGPGSEVPSTYSSGSGGALAAYQLLLDLGYAARRWEEPPAALRMPGRGSVLILAEPTEAPSERERQDLVHFVESGGRILFCGFQAPMFFRDAHISAPNLDPEWKEFHANFPNSLSRGADTIVMRPMVFWDELDPSQLALYGEQPSSTVIQWRMGEGAIIWWATATPLTNAGITRADNLRLFLNTVSRYEDGGRVFVYWDEYFHGQRGSLWSYVKATPIGWGILQLSLFALGLIFTFSRRSGPLVTPAVISRLSPLEFVETMGGLYQRAGATSIPVAVSYRRLRLELTRRLGMASTAPDSELALSAVQRLGMDSQLGDALQEAAIESHAGKVSARRALGMVQQMENYVVRIRSPKPASWETKSEEKN
jgi:Domain of unknown function (DUF4350)